MSASVQDTPGKRPGIDRRLPFLPLNIAVLTISDTRTTADDTSGGLLSRRLEAAGHRLFARVIVADDVAAIQAQVQAWATDPDIDVILTTGGTGFAPRDVTPEATRSIIERDAPGLAESIRAQSLKLTSPEAVRPMLDRVMDGFSVVFHQASQTTVGISTLQSRALAGQIGDTFIFCVPGSTGACRDAWDLVLALEFDSRFKPCSLVGQIPRYRGVCS